MILDNSPLKLSSKSAIDKLWGQLPDIALQVDAQTGIIEACSQAISSITGFSVDEVEGRHVLDFVYPSDCSLVIEALEKGSRQPPQTVITIRCLMADGSYFWGEVCGTIMQNTGMKFILSVRNITERKKVEQRLVQLAKTDSLTGLYNRHALTEYLQEKCADKDKSFSLFLLDLDKFKHINDTYGHQYGDDLLVEIARRLRMVVRQTDVVARIGGDEFVIVTLAVSSEETASRLANKILDSVAQPVDINGVTFHPRTSIGIALYPLHCANALDLLMCADKAMYQAKKQKSGFVFHGSEPLDLEGGQTLVIERVLYRALAQNRVSVYLQPIIDSQSLKIVGAEALLRLKDVNGNEVSPSDFIPVAEQSGLILELGNFVIDQVLMTLKTNPLLQISINVSGQQLKDAQFITQLEAKLKYFSVEGSQLEIELTESIFMDNSSKLNETLRRLTEMGITLSIDDFGTGYSSLSYLRYLPISKIKIDRSFIIEMPLNSRDTELVQALVQMSRPLGLKVTAEGVETKEQAEVLSLAGCHYFQGFHYYRPMSIAEFAVLWGA